VFYIAYIFTLTCTVVLTIVSGHDFLVLIFHLFHLFQKLYIF
jgi:hypothetical protein